MYHALTVPIPASESAVAVLDKAKALAAPHPIGSEHILAATFLYSADSTNPPRILAWVAQASSTNLDDFASRVLRTLEEKGLSCAGEEAVGDDAGRVLRTLEEKGLSCAGEEAVGDDAGGGKEEEEEEANNNTCITGALRRILAITRQISCRTVVDGETRHEDGLVATEFMVAAIMVDGQSVAADVLSRVSRGRVNSWNLLEAIDVDPRSLHAPAASISFEVAAINGGADARAQDRAPWEPDRSLPEIGEWCAAPVAYANYLIEGRLLIGETPGGDCLATAREAKRDLPRLVPEHVDSWVSLRGEWGTMAEFVAGRYPKHCRKAKLSCDCIFFPIEDFHATRGEDIVALVLELRRRLRLGERLYIHCRSGHGRTGMVCIPLIASLFNCSAARAMEFVQNCHDIGRNEGRDAGWSLPETRSQVDVCNDVNELVRQTDIAAGGGSSSSATHRRR